MKVGISKLTHNEHHVKSENRKPHSYVLVLLINILKQGIFCYRTPPSIQILKVSTIDTLTLLYEPPNSTNVCTQ